MWFARSSRNSHSIILDATHLCDESFRDALDHYSGPVWASHSNCLALADWNRQFTDEQFKELIGRGAVIGMASDAIMMVHRWHHLRSKPQDFDLRIEKICEHIDHICQLAGNARHVGIGSDETGITSMPSTTAASVALRSPSARRAPELHLPQKKLLSLFPPQSCSALDVLPSVAAIFQLVRVPWHRFPWHTTRLAVAATQGTSSRLRSRDTSSKSLGENLLPLMQLMHDRQPGGRGSPAQTFRANHVRLQLVASILERIRRLRQSPAVCRSGSPRSVGPDGESRYWRMRCSGSAPMAKKA